MKRETAWLIAVYFAAHGWLLITTGVFYDDWVLFMVDSRLNVDLWSATGRPFTGQFLNIVRDTGGVFAARALTFVFYLLAGLFLAGALKTLRFMTSDARFMVAAIFMAFPADSTRVLPMLVFDSMCYCLFFLGWRLLAASMESDSISVRVFSLASFFFSFWLNSLLPLYALPVIHIVYRETLRQPNFPGLVRVAGRYADFVALPILFWIIQKLAFTPVGDYEGYNRLVLGGLSPLRWAIAIKGAMLDPVVHSITPINLLQIAVVLVAAAGLWLARSKEPEKPGDERAEWAMFVMGLLAAFLALLPYVAVGKAPEYWDWLSRHARLVPLAAGLLICYGLRIAARALNAGASTALFAQLLFLLVFITGDARAYAAYWVDWYKSLNLVREFSKSEIVRDNTSFLVKDDARMFNARDRWLRFYEYAALMEQAFGDQTRFGHEKEKWTGKPSLEDAAALVRGDAYKGSVPNHASAYHLKDWKPEPPEYEVRILPERGHVSALELARWKLRELADPTAFDKSPPALVRIECKKIAASREGPPH